MSGPAILKLSAWGCKRNCKRKTTNIKLQ
ncbi:MAG: hypothetical protein WDM90_04425 [Ferruginibacter sp.]